MIHTFILSVISLLTVSNFKLFAEEQAQGARSLFSSSTLQPVVMIGIALVFFYFILWRPEKKRRQAAVERQKSLKKGDKVTAMGIIGTVDEVRENTVVLSIENGKMEVLKAAIADTFNKTNETPKENG
ncbi:MAG: preprotein translocase subunit YajC [Victivallaceae bacterium]